MMSSIPPRYLTTIADSQIQPSERIVVPGHGADDGLRFLRSVAGGTTLGTGTAFAKDLAALRIDYNNQLSQMSAEIKVMRAQGKNSTEIVRWAIEKRLSIARSIRLRQNPGAFVSLELRDNLQYGLGGRTFDNLSKRAQNSRNFQNSTRSMPEYLIESAQRSNLEMTGSAFRAAKYLRYGGPILLVLGAGLTAYNIESSEPKDRASVAVDEAGGWAGSWLLSGAAIALMVVLAPETGGLSLAGIGFLAGTAGGVGGSIAAHKIYYSSKSLVHTVRQTGVIQPHMIQSAMP